MISRWNEAEAAGYIARYGTAWSEDLALRTYLATLIGAEDSLVLHGGGNCSVKTSVTGILGQKNRAIFVKASGCSMASMEPRCYAALDLGYLLKLRTLEELSDEAMVNEMMTHLLDHRSPAPSIEALVHAFIPAKFIDHTHPDAILALTNQADGRRLVAEALGNGVLVLDYVKPGFRLALAAAKALEAAPGSRAMVWMQHGLISWGETARESYETTIELVTRAEAFVAARASRSLHSVRRTSLEEAEARLETVAPIVRGLLARRTDNPDRPLSPVILKALVTAEVLEIVDSAQGREICLSPPLTSDHLIRTKALPLWIDDPAYGDIPGLRGQIASAVEEYGRAYDSYIDRHLARLPDGVRRMDSLPRVVLMPGLGALCTGHDAMAATIATDITHHTLATKAKVAMMGEYRGMSEADLFDMEYRSLQHAKLRHQGELPLAGHVAIVTGAAGAIGSGICEELLECGCAVAVTDLPGESFTNLVKDLETRFPGRVAGIIMDVTDPASVRDAFRQIILRWGGVDLVVPNAGAALVSSLVNMDPRSFRRLELINTEGTLYVLAEAGRHFKHQGTGGDIVVVSTKNVFSPGAGFGAYSATKAAAHQLARIASLEFAELGVRVNMVSPDAVFSHKDRPSGLWAEVGPDRMKARGLDAAGLEEYYRSRNLLKARVTARHVARAVIFFATRETPTTGSTLPVDGGLPDATPR
jgi:rhamnose utilization protein RhaD (predicted bifunctional aldolase and dehydrogenase)/NAD(P)-dependent dehydrogenase (short-subunit alcohol dehydrogenase family)